MATKNKNHYSHLGGKVTHTEIVQLPLLPDHEEELVALIPDPVQLFSDLKVFLDRGDSVTFSVNEVTGGYSVCVRGQYSQSPNAGKALYSNAPSPEVALLVACYKSFVIAGMGSWDVSQEQPKSLFS